MKADLYTARARSAGTDGLAHRTAAGFVVLTSGDGDDLIAMIDSQQNESNLIDQVVSAATNNGPAAFAMLFTAGGDLYLLASGGAHCSVTSASAEISMTPAAGQVLVHSLAAGINETAATVRLRVADVVPDAVATVELQAGTVEATWVDIAIGGGINFPELDTSAATPAAEPAAETAAAAVAEAAAPDPEPEPVAIIAPSDGPPSDGAGAESVAAADPESEPESESAEPEPVATEPVAVVPPSEAPPAAQDINFADDLGDPAASAAPEPAPEPVAPDDPETDRTDQEPVVAAAPAPAPAATSTPTPALAPEPASTVGPVMVLGVACSQGHHNHPDAVYCSQCGTKMGVHHTTVLLNGPRPPLGVIVVDDGTTYSLSEDLVIGREPTSHDDVVSGAASPMILTDDTLSLSRKHARIVLDDWSVFVMDLNSSNGTWISRSGTNETWDKVDPATALALEPGDRVRVGGRILQVELHHVRG